MADITTDIKCINGEYVVKLYINGLYQDSCDYYTDDKEDAEMTAGIMVTNQKWINNRRLSSQKEAYTFIKGGNSLVTFKSVKTGKHFTYKIKKSKDNEIFFVSVLMGSDNTSDYMYIGIIRESNDVFMHTKGSRVSKDAPSYKAFAWTWANLQADNINNQVEIYHMGRCGRCGRVLTEPESIKCGFGPICAGKMS